MGFIKDIFDKVFSGRTEIVDDGKDDYETRDKVLKGLRRQRRRQIDLVEKEKLRSQINSFNRAQNRKIIFDKGILHQKNSSIVWRSNSSKIGDKGFLCKDGRMIGNKKRGGGML